ncbi:hypothetical protein RCL_jg17984.t1 [Rhizophagus clarus]|uniref:Uncharacterized protein n=1 Tax=Rhizophagus clarus TaxID=94130 RepID=A0A8H3L741_9GLOM|nr:hypothetical protein RCL_jg17984.t1 [Rhizophagus clarus]
MEHSSLKWPKTLKMPKSKENDYEADTEDETEVVTEYHNGQPKKKDWLELCKDAKESIIGLKIQGPLVLNMKLHISLLRLTISYQIMGKVPYNEAIVPAIARATPRERHEYFDAFVVYLLGYFIPARLEVLRQNNVYIGFRPNVLQRINTGIRKCTPSTSVLERPSSLVSAYYIFVKLAGISSSVDTAR